MYICGDQSFLRRIIRMRLNFTKTLLAVVLTLIALPAAASLSQSEKGELRDQFNARLKTAQSTADSLSILYNLFDLEATAPGRLVPLNRIYDLASRTHNYAVMLDALRNMATNTHRSLPECDSMMQLYSRRSTMVPVSPEQRETQVFIELNRLQKQLMNMTEKERLGMLKSKLLEFNSDDKVDVYRRIEVLFTLCLFLQDRSNSQMLLDYLSELGRILKTLPAQPGSLHTQYYVMAAMACTEGGYPDKAVEMDRDLLNIVRILEQRYHSQGRKYRSYETNYYTIYERMLGNYEVLGEKEVDTIYSRLQALAEAEPVIAQSIRTHGVAEAYYLMARKQYAKALPLLQKSISNPTINYRRYRLLRMLIEAAQSTGNGPALLDAYIEYVPMLEHRASVTDAYRVMEYEILYNLNSLKADNASLQAESLKSRETTHQRTLAWALTALLGLLAVLAVGAIAYRRLKKMTLRLSDSNQALMAERDALQKMQQQLIDARDSAQLAEQKKGDVITTLCHEIADPVEAIVGYSQLIVDSADSKRRASMEHFSNIITTNARLINTLVTDVLDASEFENSRVMLRNKSVRMAKLATVAADSLRARLHPSVTMDVRPLTADDADLAVDTDPLRVEQVLVNIISNAAKFTEKGRIDVLYGRSPEFGEPVFIVQDTGPGVPLDKQETVFGRYEKLSRTSQGIGMGLYICRLIAKELNGRIFIDPGYTDGTRVVFVIPGERTPLIPDATPASGNSK